MKKYYDKVKTKAGRVKNQFNDYWKRLMNDSTQKKLSEGAQQIVKLITAPMKDQWRRKENKK